MKMMDATLGILLILWGWLLFTEAIGQFELFAQLGGAEVFAEVSEALLKCVKGVGYCFCVGVGHVPPHAVGTGPEASHFAQCAAANRGEFRSVSDLILQ